MAYPRLLATITENPLPAVFNIQGGGTICIGDPGLDITLDGSEIGVNYELRRNGLSTGNIVPGTGAAISFGIISEPATYTVQGVNSTTSCSVAMNGSENITVTPLPV